LLVCIQKQRNLFGLNFRVNDPPLLISEIDLRLVTADQSICYPEFLGVLAEGLAGLGQLTEALATAMSDPVVLIQSVVEAGGDEQRGKIILAVHRGGRRVRSE
jgi:hypothetical protein